jgi:hypothetical protein
LHNCFTGRGAACFWVELWEGLEGVGTNCAEGHLKFLKDGESGWEVSVTKNGGVSVMCEWKCYL